MPVDSVGTGRPSIPRYQLYGEETDARSFDFVHIEHLRDRSEPHDWTIDIHTHVGLAQLMVFLDGGMVFRADGVTESVRAPVAVAIPVGTAHAFELDPGSVGYVVMLADDQLDSVRLGRWLRAALLDRPAALALDPDTADEAEWLCRQLVAEQRALDPAHHAMAHWLTMILLTALARLAGDRAGLESPATDRFRRFRLLVEDHFAEHRAVSWYGERLHLSESSLNRLCARAADRTAFEVVQDRLELEARRRLRYTTVPVTALAHELGFSDQSYFSRFFRRRTGHSPSAFRSAVGPAGRAAAPPAA